MGYWTPLIPRSLGFPARMSGQRPATSTHSTHITRGLVWPPPEIWGRAFLCLFTHFCWSSTPWRLTGQILFQTLNLEKIIFRVSYCFLLRHIRQTRQTDKHLLNIYYIPWSLPGPGSKKKMIKPSLVTKDPFVNPLPTLRTGKIWFFENKKDLVFSTEPWAQIFDCPLDLFPRYFAVTTNGTCQNCFLLVSNSFSSQLPGLSPT